MIFPGFRLPTSFCAVSSILHLIQINFENRPSKLTSVIRQCNTFQGSDYCSTQGFEVLIKRMKDGKQMSKDFEDFLKARYVSILSMKHLLPSKTNTFNFRFQLEYN